MLEALVARSLEVERLRRMACHDELTGLHNRRSFGEALHHELACMRRGGIGPAVLLLDLDGLKAINDTLGHASGDRAIQATADAILETIRETDVAARLGGDEFAVLIPNATAQGTRAAARRLRKAIESRTVEGGPLRVSVGWAIATDEACELEDVELVAAADAALYEDKRARNARPQLSVARAA